MSDFSSQGAASCAKAEVESAVSAAAIKKVFVKNPVIVVLLLAAPIVVLNKSRTTLFRQYDRRAHPLHASPCEFVISRSRLRDYVRVRLQELYCPTPHRDDSDEPRHEILSGCRIVVHGAGPGGGGGRRLQARQQPADRL